MVYATCMLNTVVLPLSCSRRGERPQQWHAGRSDRRQCTADRVILATGPPPTPAGERGQAERRVGLPRDSAAGKQTLAGCRLPQGIGLMARPTSGHRAHGAVEVGVVSGQSAGLPQGIGLMVRWKSAWPQGSGMMARPTSVQWADGAAYLRASGSWCGGSRRRGSRACM